MNQEKGIRRLELLAPAKDVETGRQAILHGADAVYIGATSHGARSSAANSIDDIRSLTEFAHRFRARVYVTVNTVVYDRELKTVERLIADLWHIGIDAIIVQDMGIMRLDIPPIELHASTQCDTRTVEKARWLENMGFSQIVLARELTLSEIREICRSVTVPVECFIHGALCVSYSGRCHASLSCGGRSANRGECAQMCRLPYTLTDAGGRTIARDKYLLSMHDLNASASLDDMIEAGVTSFKIEGRLKDPSYVKNVTAHYSRLLDDFIARHPGEYERASKGTSYPSFTPDVRKSFNRGFTDFCLTRRRNSDLVSMLTPKSQGEPVDDIAMLNNGDGIAWEENGKIIGARVNRIDGRHIITADRHRIPSGARLFRTFDVRREQEMARTTTRRRIAVDMTLDLRGFTLSDERGVTARVCFSPTTSPARTPADRRRVMEKLGETIYELRDFTDLCGPEVFIPNSEVADLRRRGIAALDTAAEATYRYHYRRPEGTEPYPQTRLDYRDNVTNDLADRFYRDHGVTEIERGAEETRDPLTGRSVMTSRHCILRTLGMCLREKCRHPQMPLTLTNGRDSFRPEFNCDRCEMSIVKL